MSRLEKANYSPSNEFPHTAVFASVENKLNPNLISKFTELYLSPNDTIHKVRNEKALKRQVFTSKKECEQCLNDERIKKIVVTDNHGECAGVLLATQNSFALSEYGPSHLFRVEADGTLPFFEGYKGWPTHYQLLDAFKQSIPQQNEQLQKQKRDLETTIPPITKLTDTEIKQTQALIDNHNLWICIDHLIFDENNVINIHQAFLSGIKQANGNKEGLLLHHYPDIETKNPLSLSQLNAHDTVDAQAYWRIDVPKPSENIKQPNSALKLTHVKQEDLSSKQKQHLLNQLLQVEHSACGIDDFQNQPITKINDIPYPALIVVDQEYSSDSFEIILNEKSTNIGLFIFEPTNAELNQDIHGYFVIVTPNGSQSDHVQEYVISENPKVPHDGPYMRIAAFVSDPIGQAQLGWDVYRPWLNQVLKAYLPNGGTIVSDTDVMIGNLRLIHIIKGKNPPESMNVEVQIQHYDLVKF